MRLSEITFGITDWQQVHPAERAGESGVVRWRTRQFGAVRVRLVECSPGYGAVVPGVFAVGNILFGHRTGEMADSRADGRA